MALRTRSFKFDNKLKQLLVGGVVVQDQSGGNTTAITDALEVNTIDLNASGTATIGQIELDGQTIKNSVSGYNLVLSAQGSGVVQVLDTLSATNITVTGNLDVQGTTTTIDSTNTTITDSLILLADGTSGAPTKDAGLIVERGSQINVGILWDESADQFVLATTSDDATTVGDVEITAYANMQVNNLKLADLQYANGTSILTTINSTIDGDITTANTNLKGYTDGAISTANVNLKGYSDATFASGSAITTANTNLKGYTDGEITTVTSAITTANTNLKGYTDGEVTTLGSAITTANTNLKGYSDATFLTSYTETNDLTSAVTWANIPNANVPESAVTQHQAALGITESQISDLGTYATASELSTANVNLKGYTDATFETQSSATTANTNVVGYVDGAVSTANINLKGYTDGQLASYATTTALSTANVNVVGYVDGEITTTTSAIGTANTNLKGYTDGQLASYATTTALTTANTNLKGYTDGEITTVTSAIGTANTNMQGYVDNEISSLIDSAPGTLDTLNEIAAALGDDPNLATTLTNTITTANTNMKGYVDGQVSTLNSSITTANTNVVGYVDSAVSTANVNLKGYADATFLTSYTETNDLTSAVTWTNIPDANVPESAVTQHQAALSVTESQISDLGTYTTASDISTANVNLKGYADATFQTQTAASTANVNLKGYTDGQLASYATTSALTTANTNVVGYVDGEITTVTSAITTANTNLKGYTDGEITTTTSAIGTANVNLKGYADATFAQQTLTADIDADDTFTIINLLDPVSAQDAVTLSYLESSLSSEVTAILNDDTSVEVNDNGVNPGNIGFVVDDSIVGNITASGLTLTGSVETTGGDINIKARGDVRFYDTDSSNYVALRSPSIVGSNLTFNLPASDGTSGQVIQTDGAGSLSFVTASGGGGGTGGFFTSTITTHPAAGGDEDLATGPSDDTLETPFDNGGTDEFGVSMGVLYDQMEPQGQYITVDLGDEEAHVGA